MKISAAKQYICQFEFDAKRYSKYLHDKILFSTNLQIFFKYNFPMNFNETSENTSNIFMSSMRFIEDANLFSKFIHSSIFRIALRSQKGYKFDD